MRCGEDVILATGRDFDAFLAGSRVREVERLSFQRHFCEICDLRNGEMPNIAEVDAFIGAYLRIEALLKLGEYEILLRDIKGFFGGMAECTGTLWEYRRKHGSRNHGFASFALVAVNRALENLNN